MLVSGGGWLHGDAVAFLKGGSCGKIIFRGTGITPNVANMVTVLAVKPDD